MFYIFDDADSEAIFYSAEFRDCIVKLKDRLAKAKIFVEIGDAAAKAPFALAYEDLAAAGDGSPLGIERSPHDELFIYTGGTTGTPKGVVWRHTDMPIGSTTWRARVCKDVTIPVGAVSLKKKKI